MESIFRKKYSKLYYLDDIRYASQMMEIMHPDFFELEVSTSIFQKNILLIEQNIGSFPSLKLLVSIVRDDLLKDDSSILLKRTSG